MRWLSVILFIPLLSSCRIERKIYSSLPVNNPSLQKKNDFSVSGTVSAPTAFDVNGGFAITNRLALIAGVYTHKNRDTELAGSITPSGTHDDSSNLVYRHRGFTLGTGIYFPLSRRNSSLYLSCYGGISSGSFRMNEEMYENQVSSPGPPVFHSFNSKLNRYFLQASLNHYGRDVEFSFTTKYNLVEYKNINTDYSDAQLSSYRLPPFTSPRLNSFFDIAMDTRIFFSRDPRLGIHFFWSVTSRLYNDEDLGKVFYHYYPFRAGTGVFFRGFTR